MHKHLKLLSTTFASFHVISILSTIVFIGSLGSWIAERWLPLSRKFWDYVFIHILPFDISFSHVEKDALTALCFFLPMAGFAIASRFRGYEEVNATSLADHAYELVALLCGVSLIVIVTGSAAVDFSTFWETVFAQDYFRYIFFFLAFATAACAGRSPEFTSNAITFSILIFIGLFMI